MWSCAEPRCRRRSGVLRPGERLVIGGLYRCVRNPVYVALLTVIAGQALLLGRLGLLLYPAVFWLFAAAFVRCREEPVLVRRFGAESERYGRAVPAWVPRAAAVAPAA
ncbi:methyltransferase family protein [Saccharopolyspora hattusasensis]|uniref:methyltransferase family protein n=1 Tax=Saccharopolyspora hattusasensis TaxID=1128679 RepID=UPI003D97CFDF